MKNRKAWCCICVVLTIFIITSIILVRMNNSYSLRVECVQSAEDAIEIGKIICQRVYPEFDYNKYKWGCVYDEENGIWQVCCSEGSGVLGGGLPEVHIKKENAQVVYIGLSF